jgi:tetratricopeptide (TPR) repeat protein
VSRADPDCRELLSRADECSSVGDYETALSHYEQVLEELLVSSPGQQQQQPKEEAAAAADPSLVATLCYACAKLAVKLQRYDAAVHYYLQEVHYQSQRQRDDEECLDALSAVSRCYHDVARIQQFERCDPSQALLHYGTAWHVERALAKALKRQVAACAECGRDRGCPQHAPLLEEISHRLQETSACMGRILFEQGNLEQAMRIIRLGQRLRV